MKFGRAVFETCEETDRHVHRTPPTGEVKKLNRLHYQLFEQINKFTYTLKRITSPQDGCKYYDRRVCMYVCLSVCLLAYLKDDTSKLHEFFCT